jgi:hypothetical protein
MHEYADATISDDTGEAPVAEQIFLCLSPSLLPLRPSLVPPLPLSPPALSLFLSFSHPLPFFLLPVTLPLPNSLFP